MQRNKAQFLVVDRAGASKKQQARSLAAVCFGLSWLIAP